jgi:hypothetical protein
MAQTRPAEPELIGRTNGLSHRPPEPARPRDEQATLGASTEVGQVLPQGGHQLRAGGHRPGLTGRPVLQFARVGHDRAPGASRTWHASDPDLPILGPPIRSVTSRQQEHTSASPRGPPRTGRRRGRRTSQPPHGPAPRPPATPEPPTTPGCRPRPRTPPGPRLPRPRTHDRTLTSTPATGPGAVRAGAALPATDSRSR